ncbi:beta-ketoacyl-[acyl-carrier-protein] synthase family protein [Saccharothrix xinjiangensis]|uniref:Beta-ketoacyl-[acyl-carrier-protein] synthase family protein n=1 Tax=Saccharothrix xinjiangensis TaxID=204798 RepID=A0ABV9Y2F0_9PSEU
MTAAAVEEPIAVTGIGLVLPGADDVGRFWGHLREGRSQLGGLTRFDPAEEGLSVRVGGAITDFDHRRYLPDLAPRHASKYSTEILAGMSATTLALRDADLREGDVDPRRLSVIESSSRGGLQWWVTEGADRHGQDGLGSGAMFRGLPASAASLAAIHLGARGLVTTLSSACVGGHHAVGLALRELRSGASDAVLVGGHEFPLVPPVLRSFEALGLGVLSTERDEPGRAVRPYSRDRNGMVLGEGALALCLERASTARERGARQYAHVLEHRAMNEAGHATSMNLTGKPTAELITEVVEAAGRRLEDVGYYCGHGTATHHNDLAECRSIRLLYPGREPAELPPLGSNKPIFGHTLGMSGIVNIAATSLMLAHQELAPTINLDEVDPECDQDHVTAARAAEFDLAVSLSFAIGSQVSVVALGAAR